MNSQEKEAEMIDLLGRLQSANLLKAGEAATIEMKGGQLLINGKEVERNVQMSLHLKDNNDFSFSVKR